MSREKVISEKNLLAVGDVTEDEVIRALSQCTGRDYTASPHHWDPSVAVHLFEPRIGEVRWYIKAYFLEELPGRAVFISVH